MMDFQRVLDELLERFSRENIRWALAGGFAMGALGAPRATADIDFLVHRDDMARVHAMLERLGYRRIHHSENVSQYDHPEGTWGSLDFIHAFRPIALEMLTAAAEIPAFSGRRKLRVLRAEDVIGLKIQALANDPARRTRELADIEALLEANQGKIEWPRVQKYCDLFESGDLYSDLRRRFAHE